MIAQMKCDDPTIGGRCEPLLTGYKRAFERCRQCGVVAYRDFIPYSLSNPVLTMPCGHTTNGWKIDTESVSQRIAFEYFLAREVTP